MFKKVGLGFGIRFGLGVALSAMLLAGCNFSSNNSSSPDKEIPCNGYLIKRQGSALQVDDTQQIDSTHLYIKTATVIVDSLGNQKISLFMSAPLGAQTYANIKNYSLGLLGDNPPEFVVVRSVTDPYLTTSLKTYGFYVSDISDPKERSVEGIVYEVTGVLKDSYGNIVDTDMLGGDRITLNFPFNEELAQDEELRQVYNALQVGLWDELMFWNKSISFNFGSVYGAKVESYPESLNDWTVVNYIAPSLGGICLD